MKALWIAAGLAIALSIVNVVRLSSQSAIDPDSASQVASALKEFQAARQQLLKDREAERKFVTRPKTFRTNYLARIKAIDVKKCPADFREGWLALLQAEKLSDPGIVESFSELATIAQGNPAGLQGSFARKRALTDAENKLDRLAVRYGVDVIDQK
jgi:hypothetical protein